MNLSNPLRGLAATRYVRALLIAKGDLSHARAFAASQNWRDTPSVEKAVVAALDTMSGGALIPEVGHDLNALANPLTILGRLPGLRRVPFETRVVAVTQGANAQWVGQGQPKPFSALNLSGETIPPAKLACGLVVSDELVRSSAPGADVLLSRELTNAIVRAKDTSFIDAASVAIANVRPASVTSGAPTTPSTGAALANIDADLGAMVDAESDAGSDLQSAVFVMNPRTASYLARLRGTGGALAYPTMTAKGGTLLGLLALTSASVPVSTDTDALTTIALLDASEITVADDGDVALEVSGHASVQMDTAPETGAQAEMVNLWQNNLTGLLAVFSINWRVRRPGMVQVLSDVTYRAPLWPNKNRRSTARNSGGRWSPW